MSLFRPSLFPPVWMCACGGLVTQEMDMINLFGSPAGRAINEITSIKLNRSEQEAARLNQTKINSNGDRQKTASIRNDFIQLNLTKFSQSSANTNDNDRQERHATAASSSSNSNLLAKKIKFWKYFEDNNNNQQNNVTSATNSTVANCRNNETKKWVIK